jgi:tetratricopeptide (TPR) repeat protein
MTLNITITTKRRIYQCADFRLTDFRTGETRDFGANQKIHLVSRAGWHALVCFFGVGSTPGFLVGDWLAKQLGSIQYQDTLDVLLQKLREADAWLRSIPLSWRRHTFSIGAFVGSRPHYYLVTNCMDESGNLMSTASDELRIIEAWSKKPKTFVAPNGAALSREMRQRLASLAALNQPTDAMFTLLAQANLQAAKQDKSISPGCFTMYISDAGDGAGRPHGMDVRPSGFPFSAADGAISNLLDDHFGPGKSRMVQFATARSEPTDEFHKIQLRDKPNDPNTHSNYGAFLQDKKQDLKGAEKSYLRALELDPNHVNALGNLANLRSSPELYLKALSISLGNENVTWNYAHFLARKSDGLSEARRLMDLAIAANPNSARLVLYRADLALMSKLPTEAIIGYKRARQAGADQTAVESGYATALHVSGVPIQESINAYRTAIALRPDAAVLHLNLSELLFLSGINDEGEAELYRAMRLGLSDSAMIEAQFYLWAHTAVDVSQTVGTLQVLLAKGARLDWDMQPSIDLVRQSNAPKADLLEIAREVMAAGAESDRLNEALQRWGGDT